MDDLIKTSARFRYYNEEMERFDYVSEMDLTNAYLQCYGQ